MLAMTLRRYLPSSMNNVFLIASFLALNLALHAEPAPDLSTWTLEGPIQLDASKPGLDGKPSIKVGPKSKATVKLRPENGSGKLTLSVYEDSTVSVPDHKKSVGPRWGLQQADGRVLVGGVMYARFFKDNGSLGIIETDPGQKNAWGGPVFAGARGNPGWMKWEFTYDPDKGVSIAVNGQPVPQKYFNWNTTKAVGFNGLVLLGDDTGSATPQTAWVGDISYELGPPMKVQPGDASVPGSAASVPPLPPVTAPPPLPEPEGTSVPAPTAAAAPVIPQPLLNDDVSKTHVVPVESYLAHHPRVIFSLSDKPELQKKAKDYPELWQNVLDTANALKAVPPPDVIQSGAKYFRIRGVEAAAVAWFVTGETKYSDAAIRWMVAHCKEPVWGNGFRPNVDLQASWCLYYLSISYDILYNQMTDADRKIVRDGLAGHARVIYESFDPASFAKGTITYDQNHTYTPATALVAASLALYGNVPEAADWLNRAHAVMARSRYVLNEDGYYYEGFGYWMYSLHWHARYAEMMERATGEDLYDLPALRDNWLFGLHLSLPGAPNAFDVGDTYDWKVDHQRPNIDVASYALLWNIASKTKAGEGRTVADMYHQRHPDKEDTTAAFLWFCPEIKPVELDAIKPYHLFKDMDVVTWRSSWKADATCYFYRGGPTLGHSATEKLARFKDWQMNGGHVHADIGSFYMYAKGAYLAVATGYTAEKWTRDQNSLLIDGKGQGADGTYHNERGVPYADLDNARIDRSYLSDSYGFVSGEIGTAYNKLVKGVKLRRSLLMTERWLLVIDDMSSEQEHKLTWLCHTDGAFQADGTAFVARLPKAGLGVIPLSAEMLTPGMGETTVMAGKGPGQGRLAKHGYNLSLTSAQPTKSARVINLLVPLGQDEKLPTAKIVKEEPGAVELSLQWPDGKTESVALNLAGPVNQPAPGPAAISLQAAK